MPSYAAVDLGASSGRIVTGRFDEGGIALAEVHRFANRPVRLPDGLHWDLVHLFAETVSGLRRALPLAGIGIDTWGADYGLVDSRGRLLGLPYHYRDERTIGMVERAFTHVPRAELHALSGAQVMRASTLFQLLAEEPAQLERAARLVMIPELLNYWMTGRLASERTIASTTSLLDVHSGEWSWDLVERLGLPARIFGELEDEGLVLGAARDGELAGTPVRLVAAHDTASAFVAAPVTADSAAVLSTGTWSLLGLETAMPVLGRAAVRGNLSNERGVDGSYRVLRNVMGLWLEQECARSWRCSYADVQRLAASAPPHVGLFDPDDDRLLAPADMPAAIRELVSESGQEPLRGEAEVARSIVMSLACKYRFVLEHLEAGAERQIATLHVVGGGARHELLNRATAQVTRRRVVAGPVEATVLGNLILQARAAGELESLAEARARLARVQPLEVYEPPVSGAEDEASYELFLDVTGLGTGRAFRDRHEEVA